MTDDELKARYVVLRLRDNQLANGNWSWHVLIVTKPGESTVKGNSLVVTPTLTEPMCGRNTINLDRLCPDCLALFRWFP